MKKTFHSLILITLIISIFKLPNKTYADINSNLQGWYKFDEASGSTALDSSGNSRSGTEVGSPTYVTGKIGPYSLNFAGASSVTTNSVASAIQTGSVTFSAWIKFPSTYNSSSNVMVLFRNGDNSSNND